VTTQAVRLKLFRLPFDVAQGHEPVEWLAESKAYPNQKYYFSHLMNYPPQAAGYQEYRIQKIEGITPVFLEFNK